MRRGEQGCSQSSPDQREVAGFCPRPPGTATTTGGPTWPWARNFKASLFLVGPEGHWIEWVLETREHRVHTDLALEESGQHSSPCKVKHQARFRVLLTGCSLGVLVQKVLSKLSNPHGHCGWPLGLDPLLCLSVENVIRENQWGGVDIRRGGVPVLRSNLICFGYSDGVVVGDEGKGLIEGNTIYGEAPIPGGRGLGSSPAREAGSPGSVSSW